MIDVGRYPNLYILSKCGGKKGGVINHKFLIGQFGVGSHALALSLV